MGQSSFDMAEPPGKLNAIRRDAGRTAWIIAVVTFLGQQGVLNSKGLQEGLELAASAKNPGASLDSYLTILQVFFTSAPFILAFAIILTLALPRLSKGEGFAPGHYLAAALLLWFAGLFGNALGFAAVRPMSFPNGNPMAILFIVFNNYLNSYGVVLLLSSMAVAWFISRAWRIANQE